MSFRWFAAALSFILFAVSAAETHAQRVLLDEQQIQRLFGGGITFTYWTGRANITFSFRDDGSWRVRTERGGEAWGDWKFKSNLVCWNEVDKSGRWQGLNRKSGCFGIKQEDDSLFLGKFEYPLTLDDPTVLARLGIGPAAPNTATAGNRPVTETLLNHRLVSNFMRDGVVFAIDGSKTRLTFTFRSNGEWFVVSGKGGRAWGQWRIDKNKICREEDGHSDGWSGLNSKSVCSTLWTDGTGYLLGKNRIPMTIAAVSAPPEPQSAAQLALAKEKQELEQQKLSLERERLALEEQRQAQQAPVPETGAVPAIDFGAYHAIVIGINDYVNLPELRTAVTDARAVAKTLQDDYGYRVHLLENPTRGDIIDKFDEMRETLIETDNLLIYYAGHGWLDEQSGRGYWLPADAKENRRSRWLSNATLTDALHAMFAKHVMIVADSCFSGTLTRSVGMADRQPNYIERMAEKRVRVALSSGGLEPVIDSGGGAHSVFAAQFLKALRDNKGVIDGTQLFGAIRKNVALNADQTPEYADIRKARHEGGDYLFVRRR